MFDGRVQDDGNATLAEFERIADAAGGVLTVAAEARLSVAWRHDGQTETAWSLLVSDQYFSMLDVPMVAGPSGPGARHRRAGCCDRRALLARASCRRVPLPG